MGFSEFHCKRVNISHLFGETDTNEPIDTRTQNFQPGAQNVDASHRRKSILTRKLLVAVMYEMLTGRGKSNDAEYLYLSHIFIVRQELCPLKFWLNTCCAVILIKNTSPNSLAESVVFLHSNNFDP